MIEVRGNFPFFPEALGWVADRYIMAQIRLSPVPIIPTISTRSAKGFIPYLDNGSTDKYWWSDVGPIVPMYVCMRRVFLKMANVNMIFLYICGSF